MIIGISEIHYRFVEDLILKNVSVPSLSPLILILSNSRLLGYEGVEVINPEGGKEDAEEEAQRGRWKQEVCLFLLCFFLCFSIKLE